MDKLPGSGWYSVSCVTQGENGDLQVIEGIHYIDGSLLRHILKELEERAVASSIVKINDDKFPNLKNLTPKLMLLQHESEEPEDFTQDWIDHSADLYGLTKK